MYKVSDKDLKEAIIRVLGIAIIRDPITLTLKELKEIINSIPSVTGAFPISYISREDLAEKGFDIEKITDNDMERLADKMSDDYCEQLYWTSMEILAKDCLQLSKVKTPYEMESKLNDIGYDREYLEALSDNQIRRLYEDEFKEK